MSRSWASETQAEPERDRAAGSRRLTMLIAACAWLCAAAIPVDAKPPRETSRVRVTDQGIRVQSGSGDDSLVLFGDTVIAGGKVRTKRESGGAMSIHVDDEHSGVVRVFSDAWVPAGKRVDGDVVAVFGSVDVEGKVDGDVVAVMGRVHLHPGAEVAGDVVSVGGPLVQDEDVVVNGETVSVGLLPFSWSLPALPVMLLIVATGWILTLFGAWLFARLAPTRLLRVAVTCSRRTTGSILVGIVSAPLMLVATVLLFITVVGIPLGLVLPIAYKLVSFLGHVVAAYVVGCKLTRRRIGEGSSLMAPIATGTLFVAAFFVAAAVLAVTSEGSRPAALFMFLLGALLLTGLSVIGTGAFLISRFGSQPAEIVWKGDVPLEPVPTHAPLAGAAPPQL
ncbi:MAG TPA: hypothetical protein VEY91_05320 [Candidatus Limnocylindria bacterium]|nr:hypothetical protein [Candidatus Limnocylindria bacterium]